MGIIYKRWVNACNLKGFECDWEMVRRMMIFKKVCQNRIKPEIWNDWEKKEFGPHRGKNGERAGERQREREVLESSGK